MAHPIDLGGGAARRLLGCAAFHSGARIRCGRPRPRPHADRLYRPAHRPKKLYKDVRDPEGLFAVIPAIATALLGCLTDNGAATTSAGRKNLASWPSPALSASAWLGFGTSIFRLTRTFGPAPSYCTVPVSLVLLSLFHLVVDVYSAKALCFLPSSGPTQSSFTWHPPS